MASKDSFFTVFNFRLRAPVRGWGASFIHATGSRCSTRRVVQCSSPSHRGCIPGDGMVIECDLLQRQHGGRHRRFRHGSQGMGGGCAASMASRARVEWAKAPPARISAATQIASMISSGMLPLRIASLVWPLMQYGHWVTRQLPSMSRLVFQQRSQPGEEWPC